jgi:hypothetical protein
VAALDLPADLRGDLFKDRRLSAAIDPQAGKLVWTLLCG